MKAAILFLFVCLCVPAWSASPDAKSLFQHAWTGCVSCLEQDIAAGMDINAQDASGATPLISALAGQQPAAAKWLIENGADPRIGRFDGFMPAHYAGRYPDLLKLIHARGGDIFARAQRGDTPLYSAVSYSNLRSIVWLMDMGASPAEKDAKGRNALHVAAEFANSPRIVEQLGSVKSGQPDFLNDTDNDGETALMKAIRLGRPPLADALVVLGARVDMTNKAGRGVAHLAVESGNPKAWEWVGRRGADLNARDKEGLSPRELAARSAATTMFSSLLSEAAFDPRAPDGKSLLHHAVLGGRLENARLLLDRRPVLINTTDDLGDTAALIAAKGGRLEMLQLLAARGADLKHANRKGATALALAAEARHTQVVEWLSRQP